MRNSIRKWQFTGLLFAIIIATMMYVVLTTGSNKPVAQTIEAPPSFGRNNYNTMKIDTFVALVGQAYGSFLEYRIEGGILEMDIKNANALTPDFFNGNEALLKFKLSDYGFEISYKPGDQVLRALFQVNEQHGVNVPNDVLIKLMDKNNKIKDVNNKK